MSLAKQLMRGVSGRADAVAQFQSIAQSMEREQDVWIASLRAEGVKAAHPDDGWVDREHNTIQFVYPQFNDGAKAGDLVALGWPKWGSSADRVSHRIVRLIEHEQSLFSSRWRFEQCATGSAALAKGPSHE